MRTDKLQAPFPWFGGKSRVANLVWDRIGRDVPNYVEPFFGSGAVLLGGGRVGNVETVNDLDGFVCNFWRATQAAPDEVVRWCDQPVNECDISARHAWLVQQIPAMTARLQADPDFFDPKIAGWWVWGLCAWIGSGWCSGKGPWVATPEGLVKESGGAGINRKLPHLGDAGRGINRTNTNLTELFGSLRDRLRHVRVCCGDWSRVLGPSPTYKLAVTAVFLDPPYSDTADRCGDLYRSDSLTVAHAVREWALANGDNTRLRIALCGY